MALYPIQNFTSVLNRIAASADSQEVLWNTSITLGIRGRTNPFYDLIGGMGDKKPFIEVADFSKVKGQQIVFTLDRPLGSPGIQGSGTLIGNEEKERQATFRATVGQMRKAISTDALSLEQTVIGKGWDQRAKKKLVEWFARQMGDEVMYEMKAKQQAGFNTFFPNNKTARSQLTTYDYLQLGSVTPIKNILAQNQASPFNASKDAAGAEILRYMIMGPHYAWNDVRQSNSFIQLMALAGERGPKNLVFTGGMPEYDDTLLHSWTVEDSKADGPIGAPCVPRARLGVAISASNNGLDGAGTLTLFGGGNATRAAMTQPLFFNYFSAAALIGHEGQKVAATTGTEYYIAIQNTTASVDYGNDQGKIGVYAYQVNNGNTLTITKRLRSADSHSSGNNIAYQTVGSVTWNTGFWTTAFLTDAHPAGSVIYEVNAKGQPFCTSYAFGRDAFINGWGSIDGSGAERHGKRIVEKQDYEEVFGIGWKQVWGCCAVQDADNNNNGFVYIESAFTPPGWPSITS